jgi:hypothetical protein
MQKFNPANAVMPSDDKLHRMAEEYQKAHPEANVTFEGIKKKIHDEMNDVPIFLNDKYQVQVRDAKWGEGLPEDQQMDMIWLSIKRIDKGTIHDWRELQQIKNEIVGEQNEAFEIYPSEDRKVDTSNQYHLWVFKDPTIKLPIGFFSGRSVSNILDYGATRQRPFNEVKVPRKARRRRTKRKR